MAMFEERNLIDILEISGASEEMVSSVRTFLKDHEVVKREHPVKYSVGDLVSLKTIFKITQTDPYNHNSPYFIEYEGPSQANIYAWVPEDQIVPVFTS